MDKKRRLEIRERAFACTLNTLERAYTKLLHQTFDEEWSTDIAASVRDLADNLKWKLRSNCPDQLEQGTQTLEVMLQHCQDEFKWTKIIQILEAAADVARSEKLEAYHRASASKSELRQIRDATDRQQR